MDVVESIANAWFEFVEKNPKAVAIGLSIVIGTACGALYSVGAVTAYVETEKQLLAK